MNARTIPETDPLELRIEAILFAAGKPLSVHEICGSLGVSDYRLVQKALRALQRHYSSRRTSLEVHRAGDAWALQVRPDLLPVAHQVAAVEIPKRTLKVLALIAYHQPMRQSLLVKMVGESAYEEVAHLRQLGFVRASPRGSTLELTTTSKFPEYFGFETADREKLKALLAQRLGIETPPTPGDGSGPSPSPSSGADDASRSEVTTTSHSSSPPPEPAPETPAPPPT
jgi:segregation and condensation protein B